ncbi:MAG TPA: polysaccharide biosynthesis tyrosine autokinase [Hanamia sp.]|nr:polysaccharide biosynthesis tyrosine autokinase [Hanamia sp.]
MQNIAKEFNIQEDSLDQNQQMQRLVFRIFPYWPLIILTILLGFLGSRIYLRYATKIYAIKARVIVNDDSQQKTANLVDIMQLDTRNMSTETEKEMEILGSRDLLGKLASKMQLNVHYGYKGYIKSFPNFDDMPFKLELQNPDSITRNISGEVDIVNDKIKFNGVLYPCDTFVQSDFGIIKWHINHENINKLKNAELYVSIQPIPQTVNQLQGSLDIEPISKQSSILALTYDDPLPERGIKILTNLLSLYGTTTVDYKSQVSANTLRFLDERIKLISGDLGGIEKNLSDYKTKNDIVDISAQGTALLGQLQQTDSKISDLDMQMDVLNNIEKYVIRRNNSNDQIPATLGLVDPVLTGLLNQLFQAEFELQKLQQTSGSKNPNIDVLQATIDKLKPSILASIKNLKAGIQVSKQSLQSNNDKLNGVFNKIPVKERQMLDISRQQEIKSGIYTFLLQKREEAAITAAGIVANYRILDKPELAGLVEPEAVRIYIWYILIALVLISFFVYLKEFSSTKLKFKSQIESRTQVPIIAEVAYQPNKKNTPIVVEEGKRTLIAEEFRELRTNLNYITFNSKNKSKVILITSSIPNEGKSFVAINTSISLCLTGSKVVLLEFDLRKPKISKELNIERNPGLSTFLIGKATGNEIVQQIPHIPNFSIVPSGPIPPNPSELISSDRLTELFDYLRMHYDYIIIDSPPIGAVTDAKILAGVADATLYIVRQNYTHSSFLMLIEEINKKKILPNFNIVFNGIKVKSIPGYIYGTSYGYGYRYGYGHTYGYGYSDDEKSKHWWKFW